MSLENKASILPTLALQIPFIPPQKYFTKILPGAGYTDIPMKASHCSHKKFTIFKIHYC